MSATSTAAPAARALLRGPATWYSWLLTGAYIYLINVQGNVVPFLQAEFNLSYRAVSLHSSAIAAGIILVGLFGERVARAAGRRRTLWLAVGGLATGATLRFPSPQATRPLIEARIGFEVMDAQAACRTYNILATEERRVAAALLLR